MAKTEMTITTCVTKEHQVDLPKGKMYWDGSFLILVVENEEGLHFVTGLTQEQIEALDPLLADSIYFPEVCL